jgi:hypothetical protein
LFIIVITSTRLTNQKAMDETAFYLYNCGLIFSLENMSQRIKHLMLR